MAFPAAAEGSAAAELLEGGNSIVMKAKFEFTEENRQLIQEAVKKLESKTAGELVIYFARSSNSYIESCWKFAGLMGFCSSAILGIMSWMWMLPNNFTVLVAMIYVSCSIVVGFLIPYLFPIIRIGLISQQTVDHSVITKARDVFLEEQVFNTVDRVGILIFVSELEHRVQVLGDEGINQKINEDDWHNIVHKVTQGISSGAIVQGLVNAIKECENLLLDNGFKAKSNEGTNELSDEIRVEE